MAGEKSRYQLTCEAAYQTGSIAPTLAEFAEQKAKELELTERLNVFLGDSVGECHVMISRDSPEYQIRKEWEQTDLPPRIQKLIQRCHDAEQRAADAWAEQKAKALEEVEQKLKEHEPQLDEGERVVLIAFPDMRGAVKSCDVFGSVVVAWDDGTTGHHALVDLACEGCFEDSTKQRAADL